jgi:hypothetical protein
VKRPKLRNLLLGAAVISTIAWGPYLFGKRNDANQQVSMKRVVFDLARPEEMRSHIKEWIPAYSGDQPERLGTIEGERVLLVV